MNLTEFLHHTQNDKCSVLDWLTHRFDAKRAAHQAIFEATLGRVATHQA